MRLRLLSLIALSLLFLWPAVLLAAPPVVPIEGKLLVGGWKQPFFLEGSSDAGYALLPSFPWGGPQMSPLADEVLGARSTSTDPLHLLSDVWRAKVDGSSEVNLSAAAGLGGINCNPWWSPDAARILFTHCDRVDGVQPCVTGFQQWVMNADGSDAHPLFPPECPAWLGFWSPDGHRLAVSEWAAPQAYTVNEDGSDLLPLPNVDLSVNPAWSRDGLKLAYGDAVGDVVDGAPGWWRRLMLVNRDGSDPQVLAQHFFAQSDVIANLVANGKGPEDLQTYLWQLGPNSPVWSPIGDRIAFCAAWEFDPQGGLPWTQSEVWMYDFASAQATRIAYPEVTNDGGANLTLSWNGPNTYADTTARTVDNTTVTFGTVTSAGLTNILVSTNAPTLPSGQGNVGFVYNIKTTAGVDGLITVEMTYRDEDLPSGTVEADLSIYHYDTTAGAWEDITISRDAESNVIAGITDSLSPFGLVMPQRFTDVAFSQWAYRYIEACVSAGIVGGYPDGSFKPTVTVDRATMAVFIARALAGGDSLVPSGPPSATFPDVPASHWAFRYVECAVDNGVTGGYPDGTYRPTLTVDRATMAVFIARAMCGGDAFVPSGPSTAFFPDVPTGFWASKYVEYIRSQSVTGGYPDGKYHPEYACTRDQMAVFVARAFALPM